MSKNKLEKLKISILRPSGNDTALVKGLFTIEERKEINNLIMQKYSNVEQVGFYDFDGKQITLEMAGGEFCGNALRSTAYLHRGK